MLEADQRRLRRARMSALRLAPPLGSATSPASALEVTRALGALQAQEYASGAWSIGVRSGLTAKQVEEAVERREIVRTWPMRGTIHWVPAEDARWMCRLLAGRQLGALGTRYRQLGVTADDVDAAARLFAEHLGEPMSRPRVITLLEDAGIDPSGQRAYHLLGHHCMTGMLCQGPLEGRQPTFVLIDAWVPRSLEPSREGAMATVVERYLRGHGPVTEKDVAGWLSHPLGFVREALALLGDAVVREELDGQTWLTHIDAVPASAAATRGVHLLPQWDEFLLGYKSREVVLVDDDVARVVPGRNLQFQPTLVVDGAVRGVWRRRESGTRVVVEVEAFTSLGAGRWREVERAAAAYGSFLGRAVDVRRVGEA
jgi:hypothetical protein